MSASSGLCVFSRIQTLIVLVVVMAAGSAITAGPVLAEENKRTDTASATVPWQVVTLHFPPFSYRNDDGSFGGITLERARKIFRGAGLDVQFVLLPWARALHSVDVGSVDAITPVFKSPEREMKYRFTDRPLHDMRVSLIARRGSGLSWKGDPKTLKGMSLGRLRGVITSAPIDKAIEDGLLFEVGGSSLGSLLKLLVAGRVDILAGVEDGYLPVAVDLAIRDKIEILEPPAKVQQVYIAARRPPRRAFEFGKLNAWLKQAGDLSLVETGPAQPVNR